MYVDETDPAWPSCEPIGNYSSSHGQWHNGSYYWNDSGNSFYGGPFLWHLFYTGIFPNDQYHWPIVVGTDIPLTAANPLQPLENFPYNFTSKWEIDVPRLVPLNGVPSNNTLGGLWPGFYYRPYCDITILNAMRGHANWYYFDTVFRRPPTDITRLGVLFWIPSGGLFATLLGSWLVYLWARVRKRKFRIRLAEGLTLYLTSALFAFPFILSITQYGPGQITWAEELFYVDASLAFFSAIMSLVLEYRAQAGENLASSACQE